MRVGIWCDYGRTLAPHDGIGVFIDNLVRGMVAADPTCRIVLKAHGGQTDPLAALTLVGEGRVRVVAEAPVRGPRRLALRLIFRLKKRIGVPPHGPLATGFQRLLARLRDRLDHAGIHERRQIIEDCDVWLLPHVATEERFTRPTVVVIHDLVTYHFPGMMSPARLRRFKHVVAMRVAAARVVACMSQFILENDLVGTLGLPRDRLRVIPAAVPADVTAATTEDAAESDPPPAAPYLLYPAGFRPYKNHAFLVEALALLRKRGRADWRIVFTGTDRCPKTLQRLIARHRLQEFVMLLGKVSRRRLAALYRGAFATVVPSRYEQGSFPLLEALHFGCPAIASAIPSLREQFAPLGDAMLYLDPDDPASLLPLLDQIDNDRSRCIARQQAGFDAIARRTWADAAGQWLAVLAEAAGPPRPDGDVSSR